MPSIVGGVRHSAGADLRAALTVWAVVVPQSLAYATLAGVPSVHGLYAAVGALLAYALFGTCRDLNMGPESTVAIMAAATVAPLVTDSDDVVDLTALTAVLVGVWCVLGFVARLGFISDFLSRAKARAGRRSVTDALDPRGPACGRRGRGRRDESA